MAPECAAYPQALTPNQVAPECAADLVDTLYKMLRDRDPQVTPLSLSP